MRSDLGDLRPEFFKERKTSLSAHRQTLLVSDPSLAGSLFHGIEFAHEQEHGGGLAILGIELEGVVKFSVHMGEAPRPYHSRSADLFVALVAVALQDAPVIAEELRGAFPRSAYAKVEDNRPAVLEVVALMVAALGLIALHADWGLVSLDVSAFDQVDRPFRPVPLNEIFPR